MKPLMRTKHLAVIRLFLAPFLLSEKCLFEKERAVTKVSHSPSLRTNSVPKVASFLKRNTSGTSSFFNYKSIRRVFS